VRRALGATAAAVAAAAVAVAVVGCGGGDDQIVVSAASSLETAFTSYADQAGIHARQSFAGSDQLAAQIRQGARPDVYAAANTALPDQLHASGLVSKPVEFATNRLVLAVPAGSSRVSSIGDLARPDVTIAVGDRSVPIGAYTREVLGRLGAAAESGAILANVRSEEPDVAGIVGKLSQGAVDAGFVYVTDVSAAGGELRAIELSPRLQPTVAYAAAVVNGSDHPTEGRRFIDGLLHGAGAAALRRAGFGPPPR
jgi:molybdate transport system substrate-binding protein